MNPTPIQHKVDGYKLDHISQYVPHTTHVFNNMTPRSNKLAQYIKANSDGKMVFVGLQMALIRLLREWRSDFFNRPKEAVMKAYRRRVKNYGGPDNNDRGIEAMAALHDLGYLPIRVRALPEGSRVPMRVPIFVVENTHPDFFWLVNYLETWISCNIWSVCNSASLAEQYYLTSKRWAEISGAPEHWLAFANHCFAARGHRGDQDAMTSGLGHLFFSAGTDTLWSIDAAEEYYSADVERELVGVSVNAFEHATASQRIAHFGSELESVRDIVTNLYPRGVISYVSDTRDLFGFVHDVMRELKDEILARQPDSLGLCKFVVRPDSSRKTPKEIILGYKVVHHKVGLDWMDVDGVGLQRFKAEGYDAIKIDDRFYDLRIHDAGIWWDDTDPVNPLEIRGVLDILWEIFGGTLNEKGLRVLNPKVGLIYGESITLDLQEEIYREMVKRGWCVSNVLFGVGSWAFLKDSSRDSYGMAIKATCSTVSGEQLEMQKTPKTDDGTKHSAKGLIRVELVDGEYVACDQQTPEQYEGGELKVVLEDGLLCELASFSDVRKRLGVNF
jgi:nicotinamide phosphoribosyltransferase